MYTYMIVGTFLLAVVGTALKNKYLFIAAAILILPFAKYMLMHPSLLIDALTIMTPLGLLGCAYLIQKKRANRLILASLALLPGLLIASTIFLPWLVQPDSSFQAPAEKLD